MLWWEILLVIALALFVAITAIVSIARRKKGKTSCGSSCAGCPYSAQCHRTKED